MNPEPVPQQPPEPAAASAAEPLVVPVGSLLHCAKTLSIVLLVLMYLIGFIQQAAGVSKIMDDCDDLVDSLDGSQALLVDIADVNCKDLERPFWWASCFQLIVVVGIGAAAMLKILKDTRLFVLILLAIATLQVMERAEEALDTRNRSQFDEEGGRIAAAGYVISAMADFLLLFLVSIKRTPNPQVPRFQLVKMQSQA